MSEIAVLPREREAAAPYRERHPTGGRAASLTTYVAVAFLCSFISACTTFDPPASTASTQLAPATNAELARFMAAEVDQLRKLTPIKTAIVHNGTTDIDLRSWPWTKFAEKLRRYERDCGEPVLPVSIRDDVHWELIAFWDVGDGRATTSRERIKRELSEMLGQDAEISRSGWEDLRTDEFSASAVFFFAKLPRNWGRLKPPSFVEVHRAGYRSAVAKIMAARSPQEKLEVEDWFVRVFLGEVFASCRNYAFNGLLQKKGWAGLVPLVARVLLDGRVRVGMTAPELEAAAMTILGELRPGQ